MRRVRLLTVVSWLGGAASILPFAADWLDLSGYASDLLLFSAVVSSFLLGLVVGRWRGLQRLLTRLAGPAEEPAHALALVAVVATAGAAAMLAGTLLAASL